MRSFARFTGTASVLLALFAAHARAEDFVTESFFNLQLIASVTSSETREDAPAGGESVHAIRLATRLTTRDLLNLLVEKDVIPFVQGWRITAVWANWPETGNGYRFHAQRGFDIRSIPEDVLKLEILGGAVAHNHRLEGDAIVGGTESFKMLGRLTLSGDQWTGVLDGTLVGNGRYLRPRGSTEIIYFPGNARLQGSGLLDFADEASADRILEGQLAFGGPRPVPAHRYFGGDSSSVSGSLQFSGSANFDNAALYSLGPISAVGAWTVDAGATLHLSPDATLSDYDIFFTPGSSFVLNGSTVLVGSALVLSGYQLMDFDPAALPSGFSLVDGILRYDPAAVTSAP